MWQKSLVNFFFEGVSHGRSLLTALGLLRYRVLHVQLLNAATGNDFVQGMWNG